MTPDETSDRKWRTSDYFAELYVAGRLADAGWNVYFPHRDKGFDFIIAKLVDGNFIVRPVQVKGKYPSGNRAKRDAYGYIGRLSEIHRDMVLAIPYFSSDKLEAKPVHVAYLPHCLIRKHKMGYRCLPAYLKDGTPRPRRDFSGFFDAEGISHLESENWPTKARWEKVLRHAND